MTQEDILIQLIRQSVNGCERHWAEVIADYLLDHGVIVPKFKIGDTVYYIGGIHNSLVKEARVEEVYYGGDSFAYHVQTEYYISFDIQDSEIGKSAFLTREEAEKAMEVASRQQ